MPSNIEIKAKANDWDNQIKIAGKLADRKEILIQEDTFFKTMSGAVSGRYVHQAANCPEGRLKLREQKGKEDYLIFYRRSDKKGPKASEYFTYRCNDAKALKCLLSKAMGKTKIIKKKRLLFLIGQTRLHFDEVQKLGKFNKLKCV